MKVAKVVAVQVTGQTGPLEYKEEAAAESHRVVEDAGIEEGIAVLLGELETHKDLELDSGTVEDIGEVAALFVDSSFF